jgi:hypothetical protein
MGRELKDVVLLIGGPNCRHPACQTAKLHRRNICNMKNPSAKIGGFFSH